MPPDVQLEVPPESPQQMPPQKRSLLAKAGLGLIRLYQLLFSSFMGRSCRFYPTCSSYAAESLRRFGFWRGVYMAFFRICRCHPLNRGGYDPVPDKFLLNPFLLNACRCDRPDAPQK